MAHHFNPSIQEAEAGGSLSLRPALSTEQVPGQARSYTEKPCLKKTKNKTTTTKRLDCKIQISGNEDDRESNYFPQGVRDPQRMRSLHWSFPHLLNRANWIRNHSTNTLGRPVLRTERMTLQSVIAQNCWEKTKLFWKQCFFEGWETPTKKQSRLCYLSVKKILTV